MIRSDWDDEVVGYALGAFLAFLVVIALIVSAWAQEPSVIPNPDLTPGVTNPAVTQENIHATICVPGWTKTIRPSAAYTNALKRQQLLADGYGDQSLSAYEEDHRVPLEVGGHPTNSANLWPEKWDGPWGARTKDKLETFVHRQICNGSLSLAEGQAIFLAPDWREGLCRYSPGSPCPPP